jgi:hypothetical protein
VCARAARARHQLEVLAAGEDVVDGGELAGEADLALHAHRVGEQIVPCHRRRARVGPGQRGEHAHHRRLARAVGTEQREHRAALDPQVDPVERAVLAEGLGDP